MASFSVCPACGQSSPLAPLQTFEQLCEQNDFPAICQLLQAFPLTNVLFYPSLLSPLHVAAIAGSKEAVLVLLVHGADPNITSGAQNSPLHEVSET
jgi:ankyrin repeat protein